MIPADALAELTATLGEHLSVSKSDLATHGHSESHFASYPPDAVAYPGRTQNVAEIVKICALDTVQAAVTTVIKALHGHPPGAD